MIFGFNKRDDEVNGYLLKVDFDGTKKMHVWAENVSGEVELLLNSSSVSNVSVASEITYCGSINLPRGEHVINVKSDTMPTRILISDDLTISNKSDFEKAWNNQALENCFSKPEYKYTKEDIELLRRHGFVYHLPKDCQSASVPSGVPLGGIGTGKIELTEEGMFTAFTGNNNQDSPIYRIPGSFFAVQTERGGNKRARLLQTKTFGHELMPIAQTKADLEFPFASIKSVDGSLLLDATINAFSPHIPNDTKDSSLPCAYFEVELSNPSEFEMTANVMFSWENIINVGGSMVVTNKGERLLPLCYHTWNSSYIWSDRRVNTSDTIVKEGSGIRFLATDDRKNPNSFGEHIIWTDNDAILVPDRDLVNDEYEFCRWFEDGCEGEFTPTNESEFRAGAIIVKRTIAPLSKERVKFVLCWYMPTLLDAHGNDFGVNYANHFNCAQDVLHYANNNRDGLYSRTKEINSLINSSSLPDWFKKRILNDRFVANTATWYDKFDNFSVNEGATGMGGCLGTLDQRTASQGYWTSFFPTLDERELDLFRQSQDTDGLCSHDIGHCNISLKPTVQTKWPDLAAAYIIQVYRYYVRTNDKEFLKTHWEHVIKAVDWTMTMDDYDCGIPYIKKGRGTTYDNQHWEGINAFIVTMQIATFTIASEIAKVMGGEQADKWRKLSEKANVTRMKYLWDDETGYFRNAYDLKNDKYDDSCFIASLAGDWAIESVGLKSPLDKDVISRAVDSICKLNVGEKGMTDQSKRKETPAFMQYPVAYLGAAALYAGKSKAAWDMMQVNDKVLTTAPSTHFIQGLTYEYDGMHIWSLPYYMTAPVTWFLLEATVGLIFDVSKRLLSLSPTEEQMSVPVFTTTSWFYLSKNENELHLKPVKCISECEINTISIMGNWKLDGANGRYENGYSTFDVDIDLGKEEMIFTK